MTGNYIIWDKNYNRLGIKITEEANDPKRKGTYTHYVYKRPDGKIRKIHKSNAEMTYEMDY